MDLVKIVTGLGILSYLNQIIEFLVLVLRPLGIIYYDVIFDRNVHFKTLNILSNETIYTNTRVIRGNRKLPTGYFMNRKCIGYIDLHNEYIDSGSIKIITTKKYYDYLVADYDIIEQPIVEHKDSLIREDCSKILVYTRSGTYRDINYSKINVNVKDLSPLDTQINIVDTIVKKFNEKKIVKVFIDGVPGSGKSSIGYCLAKVLDGKFTHSFNPTEPGDTIGQLIITMSYDKEESPNIIVIEEVDVLLNKIHNNNVIRHKDIPIMITDKTSWNSFLDDLTFYKNTILILTSNTPKAEIDKLDSAYLRNGRIDLYFSMNVPIPL